MWVNIINNITVWRHFFWKYNKMNAYNIVLLLLCSESVLAQILLPGPCPNIPPIQNLDFERYPGNWFEVERYFFAPQITGTCISVNYTAKDDGTLDAMVRVTDAASGSKMTYSGNTILLNTDTGDAGKIGNMQLTVSITNPFFPQAKVQHTYIYRIIDTDYDNYTIKWSCVSLIAVHFESVWILARDITYPAAVRASVRQTLKRLGVNTDFLKRSMC